MSHAPVWKFFVKTTGDVQCKLCAQVYEKAKDGSTGNLLYHLQQHHKIEPSKMTSFTGTQHTLTLVARPSRAVTIQAVMEWLVRDLRPISAVDSHSFRALCTLFGAEVPHSRNLTRTYLPRLYTACKLYIIKQLTGAGATASYTTDGWTDKHTTRAYLTLCVNLVLDWKLTTFCLATRHMKESHTGENLAAWINNVLSEFKIDVTAKGT